MFVGRAFTSVVTATYSLDDPLSNIIGCALTTIVTPNNMAAKIAAKKDLRMVVCTASTLRPPKNLSIKKLDAN